jgi:hypothetical protein
VLLLFQEHNSHEEPGARSCSLLLGIFGSSDHGLEFLPKLRGIGNLSVVVLSH